MKVLEKISDFAGKWMAIIALAVAIIAFVAPAPVHAALPTSWVNPLLGIVMFGMGMTLKLGDFKVVFTKPKAVITGILSQFIIMAVVSANAAKLATVGALIIVVVMLHNVCGYALGYFVGRTLGLSKAQMRTLSIEVGMQNSGLATSLATMHFATMPLAAVPGAVFSVWHNISGAIYANILARTAGKDAKAE